MCDVLSFNFQKMKKVLSFSIGPFIFFSSVPSVPGILARDYETLVMVCKLLLDNGYLRRYFDPDLLPIPWNEPVSDNVLRFQLFFNSDNESLSSVHFSTDVSSYK